MISLDLQEKNKNDEACTCIFLSLATDNMGKAYSWFHVIDFWFLCFQLNAHDVLLSSSAIKQRMEKDVDEVGKISRFIKGKIEELDREVKKITAFILVICCP